MHVSFKVRVFNVFRNVFKIPSLERRLTYLTFGKAPDHLYCKLVPNPYQYSPGTYREIERYGLTLRVDISDYIGHYLYFGFLDKSIDTLFSLCREHDNIIDIGSNIGWVALNFARLSKTGQVIGFEPDPFNHRVCKENIDRNALFNISVLPYGLGEYSGQVDMEIRTPDNRGGNRITPVGLKGSVIVQIRKLDDIREVTSLAIIHLIKLDVEGYELKVLRGGINLLKKHKPTLFIEVDDKNLRDQGDSAIELILFLESCGYYSIINAETGGKIESSTNFENSHFDIICEQHES